MYGTAFLYKASAATQLEVLSFPFTSSYGMIYFCSF